ncbi:hypothetical protein [Streptomyces parvulus]|uniref:hypothetical protein n=1 Tax=Streptomyces parvulus TaxID=146923 RepID=UPI0011C03440|nr:hypothetical protein [Streptomyces parvulus]
MSAAFASLLVPMVLVLVGLWLACAVLGVHGLLLGRLPGGWLSRHVRQPRLWGAGALLVACGGVVHSTVVVIGVRLIALGHVVKPTP